MKYFIVIFYIAYIILFLFASYLSITDPTQPLWLTLLGIGVLSIPVLIPVWLYFKNKSK